MSTTWLDLEAAKLQPPVDPGERMRTFLANASQVPGPDRAPRAGKWVAIRWDGLAVLAADADPLAIGRALTEHGIDPEDALFEYVPVRASR